jgi:hypothetical protein
MSIWPQRRPGEKPAVSESRALTGAALIGVLGLFWLVRLVATRLGSRQANSSPSPPAAAPPAPLTPSPDPAPARPAPSPDGARARSPRTGWLALVVASALAWGSFSAYSWLRHTYPPADLTASTTSLGALQPLSLEAPNGGGGGSTSWQVMASLIGRLVVSGGGTRTTEIILPLPRSQSQCRAMAARLGATCEPGNKVSVSSPVTFAWSSPQLIDTTDDRQIPSTSIEIASSGAGLGSLSVTVLAQTSASPSLCFSSPSQPGTVTLTVTSGSPLPFQAHFPGYNTPGFAPIPQCADGLPVIVGSAGSGPPEVDFKRIGSLTLHAWAQTGKLQGFAGEIDLDPGGPTVLGSPTIVSLGSRQAVPLESSVSVNPGSQSFVVHSTEATSVITSTGQLVPSYWARNTDWLVPVLGGLVTVLFNLFGVSTQVLVDAVNRRRGPVQWWRDRRARKQRERSQEKEVRHAT